MINQFQKQMHCVRKVSKTNAIILTSIFGQNKIRSGPKLPNMRIKKEAFFFKEKCVISAPLVAQKGIAVCLFQWDKTSLL